MKLNDFQTKICNCTNILGLQENYKPKIEIITNNNLKKTMNIRQTSKNNDNICNSDNIFILRQNNFMFYLFNDYCIIEFNISMRYYLLICLLNWFNLINFNIIDLYP